MGRVYLGVERRVFEADLAAKDEALLLWVDDALVGFSTQREMRVAVPDLGPGREVRGVFSGDTVIAPEHWGSPALLQAFARRYIVERPEPYYWFLVSKGHRTYRFLPTFFERFWPNRREATPASAQSIMDAYAAALYPDDYDRTAGVLAYQAPKDRLRPGLAGIGERELRLPDVAFFAERNPGHVLGHDLVCLTDLRPSNVKPRMRPVLLGTQQREATT